MAVYERRYRGYHGPLTPNSSRFLVLPRYAFSDVFASRLVTGFYFMCFVLPIIGALIIYVRHNAQALEAFNLTITDLLRVDATAAHWFLVLQAAIFGFVLLVSVGPPLVANDLRNNGLPLYLSRPFSRVEYVLGKLAVLAILLSAITWIPGIFLLLLEASLADSGWLGDNFRLLVAVFFGSWLWILTLSLCALALSAWVKWKPLASGGLVVLVLVGSGYAAGINAMLHTNWGHLFSVTTLIDTVWLWMFGMPNKMEIPLWSACAALATLWTACLLLLWRKVRAYEVAS